MKSPQLLSREKFKESVFARDGNCCVMCKQPAMDCHHIYDRSLFKDNGNYLNNGSSLCSDCHKKAENGDYTVEEIRQACGIEKLILPPGLIEGVVYDKWGNIEGYNTKYPRSLHAQISLGTTSDDRFMPDGYVKVFSEMNLIVTEKIDGQNLCFNQDGVYARSHAAPTQLPWDKTMVDLWNSLKRDLANSGLELFGESMYAIHSIAYTELEHHFYMFGVRDNGVWLSWEEVKFYAQMFDFPTVPELKFKVPLKNFYNFPQGNENDALRKWLSINLGMEWQNYTNTSGNLGGFDPETNKSCCEGFVIRNSNSFKVNEGHLPVMPNEFDSLFKIVRPKHVQTTEHWTKNWKRAKLKYEIKNEYNS